ncbi:MAG: NADH-quinone oxidoreductase subunit N [Verrucomicrobia bacterium]|nr:NADH-quinone oxidoreductase subunit N [Verrucomicrobiota bacterium]
MNVDAIQIPVMMTMLGIGVLLADAFFPRLHARRLGFVVAGIVTALLLYSFRLTPQDLPTWSGMIHLDALALFFCRLFLLATALVILIAANDAPVLASGAPAFYGLSLMASVGMMLMASADDFIMVFVALELVTISFYVLTSFQRRSAASLEAGVKYLTLGTLATSFLVLGIAFVFGASGATGFEAIRNLGGAWKEHNTAFLFGSMLVTAGLGFKIACVPFQMWAPDVYQGAPTPATAFLATGSKMAGFAVLIRLFLTGIFPFQEHWAVLVTLFSAATLLYGALGAIPQQDLKRLMGYSSIGHAGFLMMGLAAYNALGLGALLYYLAQYTITLLCAFLVIAALHRIDGAVTLASLGGLHRRSPLLAGALFLSMMSLAGVPPLSGALGKCFLFGAVLERAALDPRYYGLAAVGGVAVVLSLYYYLGVLRAAFADAAPEAPSIRLTKTVRVALWLCMAAMILLGVFPSALLTASLDVVHTLGLQ